jgi:hypothetical protein
MKTIAWAVLCTLALGALAGCKSPSSGEEVPAQDFASLPQILGQQTGTLTGQILFPSEYTQRSISIQLGENAFVTHPDGRFHIARIPVGMHRFTVRIQGFEPIDQELKVFAENTLNLSPMRLKLARGQVRGRLVFLDGQSARELPLRLDPMGGTTRSDQDGIFQFVGVHSGEHALRIDDQRFYTKALNFELRADETRNLGIVQVFRRAGSPNASISLTADRPR